MTDFFLRRPVLATCCSIMILLLGVQAYFALSVTQYPRSDVAVVVVKTAYVGAEADLVRGYISTPLEQAIASADGIDYIESSSVQGLSTITAHLQLNFDINDALTQVQAKIAQVRNELPPEAEAPSVTVENADSRFALMYLGFSSNELSQSQLTDYLIRVVQPRVGAIAGMQRAEVLGGRIFALRIWLKPEKMAALQISATEVRAALEQNNFLTALGTTKGSTLSYALSASTNLTSPNDFEALVVRSRGGTLTRLRDIATVSLGAENYNEDVRFNGEKATFMGLWALPSANSLEVGAKVHELLPQIQRALPSGITATVAYDATRYVRDAIHDVVKTLTETILIVIIVMYLFIGSFRAVLVPTVAIPLSLVGALALMYVMGFTINLLTLLAIVLAVGLVVDDAIVMLENIERHVRLGLSPRDAAFKGARELVGPTVAMTITLAAVYAPIGFQGGLSGALFREFAFTLAGAVLVSGIVALVTAPMMAARMIRAGGAQTPVTRFAEETLDTVRARYRQVLRAILANRSVVVVMAAIISVLIVPFFMFSTKELAPREDQGVVFSILEAPGHASLEETLYAGDMIQEVYSTVPEKARSFQLTSPTFGFSGIVLTPWSERSRNVSAIEGELWGRMSMIPGARVSVVTPPPLPGGSDFPVELIISSVLEPKRIQEYADALVGRAFGSGVFMFAKSDLQFDLPEDRLIIDRDKVASLGLTLADVGRDLSVLLGGNYVNRMSIEGRSYKVIPQIERSARLVPDQLENLYITGPGGSLIPVSSVARFVDTVGPRSLNRFQQLNAAKIQAIPGPGVSLDAALTTLETAAKEILPAGFGIDYAGESRQLRREGGGMIAVLLFALIFIYLVLASQFESFGDPCIILLGSVPLALSGALLFVFLDFTTINIYSQVGLVTLMGLVAKNAILVVEFANRRLEEGIELIEAVIEASTTRLRPVLMTSVATVVGHLPLVFANGPGAGARNSIGWVLVTGMVIGTFFTLLVLPALYVVGKRLMGQGGEGHVKV